MSGLYGPALPPGFRQRSDRDDDDDDDDVVSSSGVNASSDILRETCHVSSHSREADHHVTSEVRFSPAVVRHRADTHSEVSSTGQQRCCITTTRSDHQEMTVSSPSEDEITVYGPAVPNWRVNGRANVAGCPESVGEVSSSTSPVKGCEMIGPCLPPGFGQSQPNDDSSASSSTSSDPKGLFASRASKSSVQSVDTSSTVGSSEPTSNSMCDIIGPALPPGFKSRQEESEDDNEEDESDTNRPIGPCLPPRATTSSGVFGPALPPGFKSTPSEENYHTVDVKLPPSSVIEEEDEVIGPLPSEMFKKGMVDNSLIEDIEKRAVNMKDKLEGKGDVEPEAVRETWMTELPPELGPGLGLAARQFKGNKSTSTGDRSVWTDTPADRAKKLKDQAEGRAPKRSHESKEETVTAKDKTCAERIAEFNKNTRSESLLDMHAKQRKIAMEQEVAAGPKERRPFDRDVDLGVVNLNSAQRKSIIDKSHALNTRFGHGQSQFL